MRTLLLLAGVAIGALAPRWQYASLIAFAALVPLAGLASAILFGDQSILVGAAVLGVAAVLAPCLARGWPRATLFVLLVASVPAAPALLRAGPMVLGAVALAVVVASAVLAWREDVGMRVGCGLLGARLVAAGLQGEVPLWQVLAIAAAFLAASTLLRQERGAGEPRWGRVVAGSIAYGACMAGGILAAFALAPEPEKIDSARLARLRGQAAGGLVWALPSESLAWGPAADPAEFPRVQNLDARWLGAPEKPVLRLAGTTLWGQLSLHRAVARLREVKDPSEVRRLRAAADAVVRALRQHVRLVRAGSTEAEVARALLAAARASGCEGPSFPPIVASGPRAAHPHGTGNDGSLRQGELVMIDIGCFAGGYASDFTRTLPVGGRFTPRQRELYRAVQEAQAKALAACRPGARLADLDAIARGAIRARGLDDHNPFAVGHTVGLAVHDVSTGRPLEPGMVITLEPGLYLPGELGIRIEDMVLVTPSGCESLTVGFPADADAIERLVHSAR